ncbi:hypothetical protein IKF73_02880 [Candidatus Saccharibacteria bacterium]|nr:hypothetical protein [Candidatus Saccharibacteria bacterium]
MDNTLIDRETLGQFVDELIKKAPLPIDNVEELNSLREESIKNLDDRICDAIFGRLTKEQNEAFVDIVDADPNAPESVFQDFFDKAGLNLEEIITDTMKEFATEFLGGQNA